MTSAESKAFRASLKYRIPMYLWAAGLIVGTPGNLFATFVLHNRLEAYVLSLIGVSMMLPFIVVTAWLLHKNRQEMHRLEMELVVYEVLLKLADPEAYKRIVALRETRKNFKGKDLFKPAKKRANREL